VFAQKLQVPSGALQLLGEHITMHGHCLVIEVDGFLGGGEGLGAPSGLGQADGEVADRAGEVGEVGVAVERDQLSEVVDAGPCSARSGCTRRPLPSPTSTPI
jgi:hypothetical protein